MDLSPVQKLDYVLNYMKNRDQSQFMDKETVAFHINPRGQHVLKTKETIAALHKLIKDGYVEEIRGEFSAAMTEVVISFEGLIFEGYENEQKRIATLDRNEYIRTLILTYGTALAGLYGVFEILRWLFHHEHWKLLF